MRGGPGFETEIARGEVKLLVIERVIRDVHLAILAEQLAVGADDRGGVVVEAGGALLEERGDDDRAGFARHFAQGCGRGARNFFRQFEIGVVLRLAEILGTEKLRQADDLPALLGRFAHAGDRFLEVGLGLGAALHLDECDPCRGGLKARPLLRIRYGGPPNFLPGFCHV